MIPGFPHEAEDNLGSWHFKMVPIVFP